LKYQSEKKEIIAIGKENVMIELNKIIKPKFNKTENFGLSLYTPFNCCYLEQIRVFKESAK